MQLFFVKFHEMQGPAAGPWLNQCAPGVQRAVPCRLHNVFDTHAHANVSVPPAFIDKHGSRLRNVSDASGVTGCRTMHAH